MRGDEELVAQCESLRPQAWHEGASRIGPDQTRVGRFTGVEHSRGEPDLIIAQPVGDKKQGFTQYIPLRDAHELAVSGLPHVR